jgi:GNAT superfamily N-acetyltransferase
LRRTEEPVHPDPSAAGPQPDLPTPGAAPCVQGGPAHRIAPATADQAGAVVTALVDAFADYPFTNWIVPEDRRSSRLRGLFDLTVSRVGIPYGDTWVARCPEGTQEVVGAVVALPHGAVPGEVWASMATEEQNLLGDRLPAANQAESATAHLRTTDPHYTVATMGVRRDHWRRGLATRLLQPVLQAADDRGVPCYLETSTTGNVALYRRAGFTVLEAVVLPDGGPTVWVMRRLPASPRPPRAGVN